MRNPCFPAFGLAPHVSRLRIGFLLLLCGTALLAFSGCAATTATGARFRDAADTRYDSFLFYRKSAIMLGRIHPDRIELRQAGEVPFKSHHFDPPLCVRGGVVFYNYLGGLFATDLVDGGSWCLGQLSDFTGGTWYYRAGKLYNYALPRQGSPVITVYDLERRSRFKMKVKETLPEFRIMMHPEIAASPDDRRLATFELKLSSASDHDRYVLKIYDIQTGAVSSPMAGEHRYWSNFAGSGSSPTPPLIWLDNRTILCVRTDDPEQSKHNGGWGPASRNILTTIDAVTGKVEDLAQVPRDPGGEIWDPIKFIEGAPGLPLRVQCRKGLFELDRQRRRLVGDDSLIGPASAQSASFRVVKTDQYGSRQLLLGDRPLSEPARYLGYQISPDGQRVLWYTMSAPPMNWPRTVSPLFYFDAREGTTRKVADKPPMDRLDGLLWFDSRDLEPNGNIGLFQSVRESFMRFVWRILAHRE